MAISTKIETITPELAEKYLKSNNQNRRLRHNHVENLAKEIVGGRWLITHQGIAFDDAGNMIDGQHRLSAIKTANRSVQMMVTRGIPAHVNGKVDLFAMDVIDNGCTRTTGDQLNLMHGIENSNLTAAALRVISEACVPNLDAKVTVGVAVRMLEIYGEEVERLIKIAGNPKVARKAGVIGVLALGAKVDRVLAEEFVSQLATGEEIKKGDPVYALREYIIARGASGDRAHRSWFIQACANAFYNTVKGTPIKLVKGGTNGLDYLLSKQRALVDRVRLIFTGK